MEPNRTLSVNVDLHWRAVLAAVCVGAVLVLALTVTSAQEHGTATMNDVEVQAGLNAGAPPAALSDLPVQGCGDLMPTVNGECVGPEAIGSASPTLEGGGGPTAGGHQVRHVYVTELGYHPDEALWACGAGYHMASLWEIRDTSNWDYDYDHPAAHTKEDSGHGPPSSWFGWIRTGSSSAFEGEAGTANCRAWTSRSWGDAGTIMRLTRQWETAPGTMTPWEPITTVCGWAVPVWCATD